MTPSGERLARLRLARTRGIGPVSFRQLLLRFGSAEAALLALPELMQRSSRIAPYALDAAEGEAAAITAYGGRHMIWGDADYPPLLARVHDAPPVLIVAGDSSLAARRCVALVGARNASAAACRFARQLAGELGAAGFTVVSGLARGLDTAAHQGALAHGTIGVIASGIDTAFPPENADLQRDIAENHLLVSEYPCGTEALARQFPHRNRIIAGLSEGVLVVEAAPRSGSLLTARVAGDYGREVMAVPGSPLDPRAQGCNALIREGATLIQSAADVAEALGSFIDTPRFAAPVAQPDLPFDSTEPDDGARNMLLQLLGPVAVGVDELARQSGLTVAEVQMLLLELELGGRLTQHAGGRVSLS
ncbi:MAG: DNA-protecting protein DprA [Sphingomonadaceae bacterium]|nr:DNA-protecting protein DprA [Sphingomonadaceae bacterium]